MTLLYIALLENMPVHSYVHISMPHSLPQCLQPGDDTCPVAFWLEAKLAAHLRKSVALLIPYITSSHTYRACHINQNLSVRVLRGQNGNCENRSGGAMVNWVADPKTLKLK